MKLKTQRGFKIGTNINDIVVPEALKRRVSTGVKWFDDVLGGRGFTPSMATLFTGSPGAGKTTMLLTLADRLTRSGNIVVFNTCEESLYQVKATVDRLGLKNGFLVAEEEMVPNLLDEVRKIQKANPKKDVFLMCDSLQTLNDGKYGEGNINNKSAERALAMITDWCKDTYGIAIVIGQVTKDGNMAGGQKLKHMVDAKVALRTVDDDKSELYGARLLTTEKNRFGGAGYGWYLHLRGQGFVKIMPTE